MKLTSRAITTATLAVAMPTIALTPVLLASTAQAAPAARGSDREVTIFEATGVKCLQSRPSTQYVAQFTCTGFNNTTRQGAPVSVQLPDGWYKVNVENKTSTSWSGNDVLATPRDRWNNHVGTTQAVTQNSTKSFSYYDAEGDWTLVSPWNVDLGNRSAETGDQANTVITVLSTR